MGDAQRHDPSRLDIREITDLACAAISMRQICRIDLYD